MRVLLADDHPLFLEGLCNILTARGIEVVGKARNGLEAMDQARVFHPEVILMDIDMPQMDGLAATRLIKAELPDAKIVMLTMSAEDKDLFEAIRSGACGYLLKTQDTEEFFALLTDVDHNEVALSPGLASRILQEFGKTHEASVTGEKALVDNLSPREKQVLTLVAQGLTYKEVGAKLNLSERTIKYHMGEIVRRLHARNRGEVIEYARRSGLIR